MSVMEGWIKKPLSEVADITMGQSPDSKFYSEEEVGMPFLQGCAEFGSKSPFPKINCTQIKKVGKVGSILFSVRAPVGKTNLADRDYIIGRGLASILATDVDSAYLEQFIAYVEPQFRIASQGSTFEAINSKELSAWPIEFPYDPVEQTKIASILSTLDRAIEQTEAIISKQQRIKAGLMQDLLTKGIDEHGVIRSEATHQFKDSPLGRIPVEWDIAPMAKYGAKNRPYLRTGPFGSSLNTKHWVEQGVPVFTIGSLGEGIVLESELLYISDQTAALLNNYRVVSGDIVFSRVADVGRALVVSEQQSGWIISSNFMRISLDQSVARPLFLYRNIAFNAAIHSQLRTASNAGGRDLVNGGILSALIFPWPSPEEQDRINNAMATTDDSINVAKAQLANFMSTKAGLMHDLLTGMVRVAKH